MTSQQLNEVLERFDQTEPALQRKIVAKLLAKAAGRDALLAACKAVVEQDGFVGSGLMRKRIVEMKAAIAEAETLEQA